MKTILRYYGLSSQSSEPEYLVFSLLLSASNFLYFDDWVHVIRIQTNDEFLEKLW